ncbi:MAG: hypothetical protein JJ971_09720 [Balneolaceae bacterium]|nr:hypothetical protein [Balneolaceae bacterium]MBO6546476.1 hypothetical protein [Balneolaceae bacterium]MBO6648835.1 hypothetical protein [Balneolaceae bacterium]
MRQIQQLIQVLNTVLTQVLKVKEQGQDSDIVAYTNEMFEKKLGFDLDELSDILEKDNNISHLKKEKGFTNEHLSILADILYELGEDGFELPEKHTRSVELLTQSLTLYEFIELDDRIYSIDRNLRITKIKDYLN